MPHVDQQYINNLMVLLMFVLIANRTLHLLHVILNTEPSLVNRQLRQVTREHVNQNVKGVSG